MLNGVLHDDLGGSIGRFSTSALDSGATGQFELRIAVGAMPQPNGAVAAQVGGTWSFQAWFRDANPSTTSNFTDAIAVIFE